MYSSTALEKYICSSVNPVTLKIEHLKILRQQYYAYHCCEKCKTQAFGLDQNNKYIFSSIVIFHSHFDLLCNFRTNFIIFLSHDT